MSPRYVSYWDAGAEHETVHRDSCTVFVEARQAEDTGLLDANGVPLYRLPDNLPVGFHRK